MSGLGEVGQSGCVASSHAGPCRRPRRRRAAAAAAAGPRGRRPLPAAPQPVVADGVRGGDAFVGVELEAAAQEVDELGVVRGVDGAAGDQRRDEVARERRSAVASALRVATRQLGNARPARRLHALIGNMYTRYNSVTYLIFHKTHTHPV